MDINTIDKVQIKEMFKLSETTLENFLGTPNFPKKKSKTKWDANSIIRHWNTVVNTGFENEPVNQTSGKIKSRTSSIIDSNETKE